MTYTVKQLAELSGVSVRTLHFYDEIGLLKPAHLGDNNYRYYEKEQLLLLQQILFFRELKVPLNDIKQLMQANSFNKLEALVAHRNLLKKQLEKTHELLATLDKTIDHMQGIRIMLDKELFAGFNPELQKTYETYLIDHGVTQETITDSWERVRDWKEKDWRISIDASKALHEHLAQALVSGAPVESAEVQRLIQQHYDWVKNFWTPDRESYIGLGKLYVEHEDFKKFYTVWHPELPEFLMRAMRVFADKNLQ